jgi:hypothetical protein
MELRMFLETQTAASLGVLAEGAFANVSRAQNNPEASAHSAGQGPFETAQVEVSGNTILWRADRLPPGRGGVGMSAAARAKISRATKARGVDGSAVAGSLRRVPDHSA